MSQHRNVSSEQIDCEVQLYQTGLRSETEISDGSEPVIDAFSIALPELIDESEGVRELVAGYFAHEQIITHSYRKRKLFACTQLQLLDPKVRTAVGYPDEFDDPARMKDVLRELFADPRRQSYTATQRNLHRALQTNRSQRAVVLAVSSAALTGHQLFGEPTRFHEWGSAGNFVLKAMATQRFKDVSAIAADGSPDPKFAALFNFISHMSKFGTAVGIEAHPPMTADDHAFIKACSLNPSQLDTASSPSEDEETYDLLSTMDFSAITDVKGNFFRLKAADEGMLRTDPSDIASLSFVLGQNQRHADALIQRILPTMRRDGKLIITDYVNVHPHNRTKLRFPKRWDSLDWPCKTVILDKSRLDEGFQTVLEWKTGVCETVRCGPDSAALGAPFAA